MVRSMNFDQELNERVKQVEEVIYEYLPAEDGYQKTVIKAMNYTMKAGGKRLRPMLMNETYRLFGGEDKVIQPFMAAIEMIHTYSLVHDDLPALDNDDYRRGRKTAHVVYGEAMAILAGDSLLNYAFEVALSAFANETCDIRIVNAMKVLAAKPGIYGMIGGQTADIELTGSDLTLDHIGFIHKNKTGALIEASMMIGAILGGADKEQTALIESIAGDVGLAFQIQDDILDITGDVQAMGKPMGSDARNGKVTYVTIKGLEEAQKEVEEISMRAIENLNKLPYGNEFLTELIRFLISRKN